MLDYEYIKNHYKLVAVDFCRQKELDAETKEIQEIEFVGQLNNANGANSFLAQPMFILTILEKIK